jgi:cytochrome c oxidase subunit 4
MENHIVPVKNYVMVWLALMIGTVSTYLIAEFVDMGVWNIVVALLIAATKMSLVIYFFMHVKFDDKLTKLFVAGGFIWLFILISVTMVDYLSRYWQPYSNMFSR